MAFFLEFQDFHPKICRLVWRSLPHSFFQTPVHLWLNLVYLVSRSLWGKIIFRFFFFVIHFSSFFITSLFFSQKCYSKYAGEVGYTTVILEKQLDPIWQLLLILFFLCLSLWPLLITEQINKKHVSFKNHRRNLFLGFSGKNVQTYQKIQVSHITRFILNEQWNVV